MQVVLFFYDILLFVKVNALTIILLVATIIELSGHRFLELMEINTGRNIRSYRIKIFIFLYRRGSCQDFSVISLKIVFFLKFFNDIVLVLV